MSGTLILLTFVVIVAVFVRGCLIAARSDENEEPDQDRGPDSEPDSSGITVRKPEQ